MKNRTSLLLTGCVLLVLVLGACVPAAPAMDSGAEMAPADEGCAEMTEVKLQLQWVTQSQFAGYFCRRRSGLLCGAVPGRDHS